MLEPLLESKIKETILIYLYKAEIGYAYEISQRFDFTLCAVQNQLANLERGGVLQNKHVGKTSLYRFNPDYPFRKELQALLDKAFHSLPKKERSKFIPDKDNSSSNFTIIKRFFTKGVKMSTLQKAPALKHGEVEYFRSKTKGFCDLEGPRKVIKEGFHIPKPVMEAAVAKGFDNEELSGGSLIEIEQENGKVGKVMTYSICKDCYESLKPFLD